MKFDFTIFPTLKTNQLLLKKASYNDSKAVFELRSNEEINKFVGTKKVKNLEEATNFILTCNKLYQEKKRIFWLIEFNKQVIGSIVLHNISLENSYAEIGYKLKTTFHKKGIMSEALKAILNFGFYAMGLKTIEAFTHKNNTASIALLKKHHFKFQKNRKCPSFKFNRIFKLEAN